MTADRKTIRSLIRVAYDPYDRIEHPTTEDWQKSYDALKELCVLKPKDSLYPNTLGYLCYYGRHTGGKRRYREARQWFEKGAELRNIESCYKLADMLSGGLGGPKDPDRALTLYLHMYYYCKDEFESGVRDCKLADVALRMGRLFYEGKITRQSDSEALQYLLEAKYAIGWRKPYDHYGDDAVEKNILDLIDACEQPDEEVRRFDQYGVHPAKVAYAVFPDDEVRLALDIGVDEQGIARLKFRRKRKDGKKANKILFSVPPAMKVFLTDSIVLYGAEIRRIWTRHPGETVLCDYYTYDEEQDAHLFYLEDELQCSLTGGRYVLPMDEFWMNAILDNQYAGKGTGICQ